MSNKSLAEQMAAKKKAEAEKKTNPPVGGFATGAQSSVEGPATREEIVGETPTEAEKKAHEAMKVAEQSGATEIPTLDDANKTSGVAIVQQGTDLTEAEIQTQRTEVSTNVIVLDSTNVGGDPSQPNPPSGTLPNSNLVYQEDPESLMGKQAAGMAAGIAENAELERQNEIALKILQGEEKRQRLLEGRPRDTDIAEENAEFEAPEGGYKATGMVRFVNAKGNWVNAVNGYFVPQDEEEAALLEHYVTVYAVEAPAKPKKK